MRVDTLIDRVVARFIGTKHERDLKLIQPLVTAINALAPEFEKLTDVELLEKTVQLRTQVQGRLGDLPLEDPQFKERCKEALEPALVPAFGKVPNSDGSIACGVAVPLPLSIPRSNPELSNTSLSLLANLRSSRACCASRAQPFRSTRSPITSPNA